MHHFLCLSKPVQHNTCPTCRHEEAVSKAGNSEQKSQQKATSRSKYNHKLNHRLVRLSQQMFNQAIFAAAISNILFIFLLADHYGDMWMMLTRTHIAYLVSVLKVKGYVVELQFW